MSDIILNQTKIIPAINETEINVLLSGNDIEVIINENNTEPLLNSNNIIIGDIQQVVGVNNFNFQGFSKITVSETEPIEPELHDLWISI